MAHTGPAELLAVWEAGAAGTGARRTLLLHRAARPGDTDQDLLAASPGERETELLRLRRALFGDRMRVLVECAACGEAMEFDLDARELADGEEPPPGPLRVEGDGWTVEFRLPSVADLAAVAGAARDAAHARELLLARCTVSAVRDGSRVEPDALPALLPEPLRERLAEAAERADPAADLTLNIACPECGAATRAELDVAAYLWTELDAWARDLLLDVHLLATAYGWSEPEVLALSPLRRRYYLELCADA